MKINELPQKKGPEIRKKARIADTRFFHVEELHLEFSNHEKRIYERLISPPLRAVLIVPMLDDETVLLIQEYAGGMDDYEVGLPKGSIDPGESAEEAANRELKEEIGYGARKLTHLKDLSMAPGYMGHKIQIFLAQDLYEEKLEGDEPEPITVIEHSIHDIDTLIARDDFQKPAH